MSVDWRVTKAIPDVWPEYEYQTMDRGEIRQSAVDEVKDSWFLQLLVLEILGIELSGGYVDESNHPCVSVREHIQALREVFYKERHG